MSLPSDELLPCPFCGGTPDLVVQNTIGGHKAICTGCGAWGHGTTKPKAEATAAWNTRARSAREDALVEALKTARDYVSDAAEGHLVNRRQHEEAVTFEPVGDMAKDDLSAIDAALAAHQEAKPAHAGKGGT